MQGNDDQKVSEHEAARKCVDTLVIEDLARSRGGIVGRGKSQRSLDLIDAATAILPARQRAS